MRKPITTKLKIDKEAVSNKDTTVIIMIRNGYGTGTKVPTKELYKNKKIGGAILFMLDESLKDAIENGK